MNSQVEQLLESVVISPNASITEAIGRLDKAGTGGLVLCSTGRKLCGFLSDGDIRRAILHGVSLENACGSIAARKPVTVQSSISVAEALHLMNRHDINHLPVIDENGDLQNLLLRKDLIEENEILTAAGKRLENVVISPAASIHDAITRLDKAGTGALLLCSDGLRLCGLLTDGDIRRAILRGIPMEAACEKIASPNPVTAQRPIPVGDALYLMNQYDINHLPVVDGQGNVVALLLRKDLVREDHLSLSAVIMAGGFGKRLLPLTERVPKPMLPVGDRPLLELTIQKLHDSGIRDVNLTTHYLPESIMNHFGNGEAFGVRLNYLQEDNPLGTAGGLRVMKNANGPILVLNGDILTGVSLEEMLVFHREHGAELTMGVRKYEMKVPYGVVKCNDVRVEEIREKPSLDFFINAGLYLLEPSACDCIPEERRFDMTDLIRALLDAGRTVVGFPIIEYWLDVGRYEDYKRAQKDVRNGRI